jgi:hypothetical protein
VSQKVQVACLAKGGNCSIDVDTFEVALRLQQLLKDEMVYRIFNVKFAKFVARQRCYQQL